MAPPKKPTAVRQVPMPRIVDMPVDTDDDDDERDEDLDAAEDEAEDADDDDDEVPAGEGIYVALERDSSILIVYANPEAAVMHEGSMLEFSQRGIWRMDAEGGVELLDGVRDGVALPVASMSNYCGIIDRVPGETPQQTSLRAKGELAERIKLVLQRTSRR